MQRSKRSICGRNWIVLWVSAARSPDAGCRSRKSPWSSDVDSNGLACASHGYAAVIVGGSWGSADAKSLENCSVAGNARSSEANAVLALVTVGPSCRTVWRRACCWAAVVRSVRSKSEMNEVSWPSARARPALACASPETTCESWSPCGPVSASETIAESRSEATLVSKVLLSASPPVSPRTDGSRFWSSAAVGGTSTASPNPCSVCWSWTRI